MSKAIHDSPISRTFLHEPLTTLADKLGFKVCFAGETKLVAKGAWGEGLRRIDQITLADEVASRDENDPNGPIEWKKVEELFERFGPILHLHLAGGKLIRTTPEHPFFEYNKGWTEAGALQPGDTVRTDNGWVKVEEAFATGTFETVYNLRVADFHTYFVGCDEWGFSVWAHNAECFRVIRDNEDPSAGLRPKNPNATYSLHAHVSKGSTLETQYISTTKSRAVAEQWRRRTNGGS